MEIVCLPNKPRNFYQNTEKYRNDGCVYLQPARPAILNPRRLCPPISSKIESKTTYKVSYPSPRLPSGFPKKARQVQRFGKFDFATSTKTAYKWPEKSQGQTIYPIGRLGFVKDPMDSKSTQQSDYVHPGRIERTKSCKKICEKRAISVPMESLTTNDEVYLHHDQHLYINPKEKSTKKIRKCLVNFKTNYVTSYQENFRVSMANYGRRQRRNKENKCPVLVKFEGCTTYSSSYKAPGRFIKLRK